MRLTILALSLLIAASAQQYDILLRGGHVMDPGDGVNAQVDVGITGDRIAAVGANIPAASARRVVDASKFYVVPGLVDLHVHVFAYSGTLVPDETSLPAGATTVVDAGGSGWRTFDEFRKTVITQSKTRVLAWINIVGRGMVGGRYESDTEDMDPAKTADTILRNRDIIMGIKTAHYGRHDWTAIDRAVEAGRRAKVPVMVDDSIYTNSGRTTREKLLVHLRPGDIHTHMYNDSQLELIDRFSHKVQPWMLEARKRGVLFDLGHGNGSFLWPVAEPAVQQGFVPDTISTDLWTKTFAMAQATMPNVMSKMMYLGMGLEDVIMRSTVNPAKEIGKYPELGTLGVGRVADIAVLELQTGVFALKDAYPAKRFATKRLEPVMTIRAGKIVYERGPEATPDQDTMVYDLLFKHARLAGRGDELDVGIVGDRIARIRRGLKAARAKVLVEAEGYQVTSPLREGDPANLALADAGRTILTVRNGRIATDDLGLSLVEVSHAGQYGHYTNFQ